MIYDNIWFPDVHTDHHHDIVCNSVGQLDTEHPILSPHSTLLSRNLFIIRLAACVFVCLFVYTLAVVNFFLSYGRCRSVYLQCTHYYDGCYSWTTPQLHVTIKSRCPYCNQSEQESNRIVASIMCMVPCNKWNISNLVYSVDFMVSHSNSKCLTIWVHQLTIGFAMDWWKPVHAYQMRASLKVSCNKWGL